MSFVGRDILDHVPDCRSAFGLDHRLVRRQLVGRSIVDGRCFLCTFGGGVLDHWSLGKCIEYAAHPGGLCGDLPLDFRFRLTCLGRLRFPCFLRLFKSH